VFHEDFAGHVVEDFSTFAAVCEVGGVLADECDRGVGVASFEDELVEELSALFVVHEDAGFVYDDECGLLGLGDPLVEVFDEFGEEFGVFALSSVLDLVCVGLVGVNREVLWLGFAWLECVCLSVEGSGDVGVFVFGVDDVDFEVGVCEVAAEDFEFGGVAFAGSDHSHACH